MNSTTLALIELGAVFFALGALGRVAARFAMSPIPFYLLGGLAFGTGGFIQLCDISEFSHVASEIGVVLLLLLLGLEYTASELVTGLKRSRAAGLLDLVLNAAPGVVIALLLGWGATAAFVENPRVSESSSPSLVHGISGWRQLALWPVGFLMRLWGMTLRFETAPEDLARYHKRDEPIAIVLWHNRLFLSAEIVRRFRQGRPAYALVSASKDGAWLSAFFSLVGMRTVRGSSSRLGREAATALVEVLRSGDDIGITPDGPRGPCYDLKAGALIVARRTKTPLLLVGATFHSAWRMKSWDRFYLPKPFSRVTMRSVVVPAEALADRDAATEQVRAQLLAINPDETPVRTSA